MFLSSRHELSCATPASPNPWQLAFQAAWTSATSPQRWKVAIRQEASGPGPRGEAQGGSDPRRRQGRLGIMPASAKCRQLSQCARTDAFAAMPSKASCCDSRLLLLAFRVACNLGESLDVLQTGTLKELAETGQLGSLPAQLALQRLRDCILHPKQSSASADDGFGRPATKAVTSFRAERPRFHLVLGSDVVYDSYHGRQLALVFLRLRFMPCWDL